MPAEPGRLDTASAAFWEQYHATQTPQVSTQPDRRAERLPYIPALDGIRALAVAAVLLYHADNNWLPGGFLGVEVFFVVSGYLITSLLLAEWRASGRVDLKSFWLRRARRLLPALYVLLAVSLTFAVLFLPKEVARLRGDAIAAATYVTNWWLIFGNTSYFETVGRPSAFQHLWSLAVEEQFYLLWPPLFVLGMTRWQPRRVLLAVLGAAAVSTALMAALYQPAVDPSRLYYGTETRAAELLVGVALAFVWEPGRPRPWTGRIAARVSAWLAGGRGVAVLLDATGLAALGAIILAFRQLGEFSPFLYRGGFLLVALATAALIAAVAHPRTRLTTRLLGTEPLRWIGLRSYGIYLWYWPVYVITRPELDVPLQGLPLLIVRVALILTLAEISYRWVETPFRSGAVGRAWRSLREGRGTRRRVVSVWWAGVGGTVATFTVVLGVLVAQAKPAGPPPYLAVRAVHISAPRPTPTPTATPQPALLPLDPTPTPPAAPGRVRAASGPTPVSEWGSTAPPPRSGNPPRPGPTPTPGAPATPTPTPAPTATPTPTASAELASAVHVTAIGDSVMVGASQQLAQDIPNLDLDAEIGLQVPQAIAMLQARRDSGQLGQVVVIHIGNNGLLTAGEFDQIMQVLTGVRRVVFVNLKVPRPWEGPNNQVLADGVKRYPNAALVDWRAASVNRPDLFWDDGIHLNPEGAQLYAQLIAQQVEAAK